jgi:hypothetical protein
VNAEGVFAVPRLGTGGHDAWAEVHRRGLEAVVIDTLEAGAKR